MNRKEIEQKYIGDGGLENLVLNNPVKYKKYATKEATSKNLSRTLKNMSSFGPNFTDTNFAIVDARDAMQKVIDIADKAGYGAVKNVAKKLKNDIIALWNLHKKEGKMPNKRAV